MSQVGDALIDMRGSKDQLMRSMEEVPTQVYWAMAVGAVLLSAFLYLTGRRNLAIFVGQWPPTFLALALLYKLLTPSREQGSRDLASAVRGIGEAVR